MLVRKINPEWYPSENKSLKVGETIEISDPKALILNGDVAGLDADGIEVSSYDLYGIISREERKEFEAFKKVKQQEAIKIKFLAEQERLKKEIEAESKEKTTIKKSK